LSSPRSIKIDRANDRVLLLDDEYDAVLVIELNSGQRAVVSGEPVGIEF